MCNQLHEFHNHQNSYTNSLYIILSGFSWWLKLSDHWVGWQEGHPAYKKCRFNNSLYACLLSQLEHRVEKAQEEFEGISTSIRKEVERFELQRYHDFKAAIITYLESVLNNQQQVCSLYLWSNQGGASIPQQPRHYSPNFSLPYSTLSPPFPTFPPATNWPPWNQLGVWGSAVSSPSGVWGEAPADIDFGVFSSDSNYNVDFCILKFLKLLIKSPQLSLAHMSPTVDRDRRPWNQAYTSALAR